MSKLMESNLLWEYGKGQDVVALELEPNGEAASSSACDLCGGEIGEVGGRVEGWGTKRVIGYPALLYQDTIF